MNGTIISWQRTPITIGVGLACCIVTIVLLMSQWGTSLFNALAFSQYRTGLNEIQSGQLWRLITPIFMHGSWGHLIFNIINLVIFGARIEIIEGPKRYLGIIVVSATAANFAQWWMSGPLFLGISGTVFALIGFLGVRQWRFADYPIRLPRALYIYVLIYIVAGVSGILDNLFNVNIGNASHIAGLIAGGILALKR